jgi:hypothetical protein
MGITDDISGCAQHRTIKGCPNHIVKATMSVWIKQQPIRTPKPQQAPVGPNRARTAAQNYDRDIQILLQINSVLSADFDWAELVIAPSTSIRSDA